MENLSQYLNTSIPVIHGAAPGIDRLSIEDFCHASDAQAVSMAVLGVVLGIALIVWFGKARLKILGSPKAWVRWCVPLFDKLFLTLNGLVYVIILTRLLHAGL